MATAHQFDRPCWHIVICITFMGKRMLQELY